jgi:hypothetical protein
VATLDKDFKVKNGLSVALGGSFGGTVSVGSPTDAAHAATKEYVDNRFNEFSVPTESDAPLNPVDGQFYFNTTDRHLSVYSTDAAEWIMIATFDDTANLRQHIHDTSIDGTGLIVTVFQDSGFYDAIFSAQVDGGSYNTEVWDQTFDGGTPIDNFN